MRMDSIASLIYIDEGASNGVAYLPLGRPSRFKMLHVQHR